MLGSKYNLPNGILSQFKELRSVYFEFIETYRFSLERKGNSLKPLAPTHQLRLTPTHFPPSNLSEKTTRPQTYSNQSHALNPSPQALTPPLPPHSPFISFSSPPPTHLRRSKHSYPMHRYGTRLAWQPW